MDILEGIYTRRSIRSYTGKAVSREMIHKLLEAATLAPSASNRQPWAFAVFEGSGRLKNFSDKSKVCYLHKLGDDDPRGYRKTLSHPKFNIFWNACTLIVIYAKDRTGSGDCCLAAQNLMLAAHALGLGTCWIGFAVPYLDSEEFKNQAGIAREYEAVAPIIVGYPKISPSGYSREVPEILCWKDY